MSHFAKVEDGIVTEVIVAEQDVIDSGLFGDPSLWIQTSYNTRHNDHLLGGTPVRGNFAGVGYTYDAVNDIFMPPKPFPSWVIDSTHWFWTAPLPYPGGPDGDNKAYMWDEAVGSWIEVVSPETPPV